MQPSPPKAQAGCQKDANSSNMEVVLLDEGASIATQVQSKGLELGITIAEPAVAAGIAMFGLGLLVLPLLAPLASPPSGSIVGAEVYAYDVLCSADSKRPPLVYSRSELKKRLGMLDVAFLARELAMDEAALAAHMEQCDTRILEKELAGIRRWQGIAKPCVRLLQKRAALAFLGLPPAANEADVNRVYKKMALELHPDKGGCPKRFQELQQIRGWVLDAGGSKRQEDAEDEAEAEEHVADSNKPDEGCGDDTSNEGEEEDTEEKADKAATRNAVVSLRARAHSVVTRIWHSIQRARDEITNNSETAVAGGGTSTSSQEALKLLQSYSQEFGRAYHHGNAATCDEERAHQAAAKLHKFLRLGAEVVALAAMADPNSAHTLISTHIGLTLVAHCDSSRIHRRCAMLLDSTLKVRDRVADVLAAVGCPLSCLQDGSKGAAPEVAQAPGEHEAQWPEEPSSEKPATTEPRLEEEVQLGKSAPGQPTPPNMAHPAAPAEEPNASNLPMPGQPKATTAGSEVMAMPPPIGVLHKLANRNLDVFTFTPPPMQCGAHRLVLRLIEREGLEELEASISRDDAEGLPLRVASLRGAYLLRGEAFQEARMALRGSAGACASSLFDITGRAVMPLLPLISPQAHRGALLFLEDIRVLDGSLRGRRAIADFVHAVLRCLAGPMKQVTLAIAMASSRDPELAAFWRESGFQQLASGEKCCGGSSAFFLELGAQRLGRRRVPAPKGAHSRQDGGHNHPSCHSRSRPPPAGQPVLELSKTKVDGGSFQNGPCEPQSTGQPTPKRPKVEAIDADSRHQVDSSRHGHHQPAPSLKQKPATSHPKPGTAIAQQADGRKLRPTPAPREQPPPKRPKTEVIGEEVSAAKLQAAPRPSLPMEEPVVQPKTEATDAENDQQAAISHGVALPKGSEVLTPRMRCALLFAAQVGTSTLRTDAATTPPHGPRLGSGSFWGSTCLPANVQRGASGAFIRGMAVVADAVASLLRQSQLPTVSRVAEVLARSSAPGHNGRSFLAGGGSIPSVLRALIEEATKFYEAREAVGDDEHLDHPEFKRYHGLPMGMLDGDFEFLESTLLDSARLGTL